MREAQVCTPLTEGTQGGPGDLRIIVQMASGKSGFTSRQLGSRVHPLNHCRGQPPTKAALQWVSQCYGVSPGAMEAHGGGAQSGTKQTLKAPGSTDVCSASRERPAKAQASAFQGPHRPVI